MFFHLQGGECGQHLHEAAAYCYRNGKSSPHHSLLSFLLSESDAEGSATTGQAHHQVNSIVHNFLAIEYKYFDENCGVLRYSAQMG